ncbi:MAG: ribbon-helix-helix domain-containing protein [Candidatus Saccharimonadales bacterium]
MSTKSIKTFNISFPASLADEIDDIAKEQFGSRSDFLRAAALKYIQEEKEWRELLDYGKEIGKSIGYQSEEEVAAEITRQRRQDRQWQRSAN